MIREETVNARQLSRDDRMTKTSSVNEFIKRKVLGHLRLLERGSVTVVDGGTRVSYGEADCGGPNAIIVVKHEDFYKTVFSRGSLGAAEAYMDGLWDTPDLLQVVRVFSANLKMLSSMKLNKLFPSFVIEKILHTLNDNSKNKSKKNISRHYDLGNNFFELFLDPTMMYSSGIFKHPTESMFEASNNKLTEICERLNLTEGEHVLEIGTGWGGFAVFAAKHYGCKVTTTTISREQYDYTNALIKREGLEDSIRLLFKDYRELSGAYDKLVSIEMIEAVGHKHYKSYFSQCDRLLKEGGLMLVQAITMPGQRYEQAKKSVDFIQKYIFPGGFLPSVEVVTENLRRYTSMQLSALSDLTHDYALTLERWREAFNRNIDEVKAQGFDDRFCRMWNYYLCYCEGGFRERIINTNHLLLIKP